MLDAVEVNYWIDRIVKLTLKDPRYLTSRYLNEPVDQLEALIRSKINETVIANLKAMEGIKSDILENAFVTTIICTLNGKNYRENHP